MGIDPIAALGGDAADDAREAGVVDIGGSSALAADHVVMMVGRLACDVRVIARRQVDPLDRPDAFEGLERPEDRRPSDRRPAPHPIVNEIGGREMALAAGDEVGDRASRAGQAISGPIQGAKQRNSSLGKRMHRARIRVRCARSGR